MATARESNTIIPRLDAHEIELGTKRHRAARSIHSSSYIDCGLKTYHSIKDTPAKREIVPAYSRDAAYGESIHGVLQERLIGSGLAAMVPNFDYNTLKRETARIDGVLSPAIEMPLNEHTLSPEKWAIAQECMIGGRVDGIVQGKTGKKYVFEIKTVKSAYLPGGRNNRYFGEKLSHFEAQVQLYLFLLEIDEGFILCVNRDDGSFYEWRVAYDALFIEPELDRLRGLAQKIRAGIAPEPEPSRGPCNFCEWESICPAFAPASTEEVVHPCGAHVWMGTARGKGSIRFYTAKGVQVKDCATCHMSLDRRETVSVEEFIDMELHPEEYLNADMA